MSVDEAAVAYWIKELVPAFTQVPCQLYQQCAKFLCMLVLAQDLREAKRIIALLLVNELRNLGDLRHADPPHGWMWAERLSPDLLEHLQQLLNGLAAGRCPVSAWSSHVIPISSCSLRH